MNDLPDLPRQLDKKEADVTPRVLAWMEKNWPNSAGIEVKIEKGKLKDHQARALKKVDSGTFIHKLKDTGDRQPFDAILLKDADAVVVRVYEKKNCIAEFRRHKVYFTI